MDGGTCAVAVLTDLPPFTDAATKLETGVWTARGRNLNPGTLW
jgi:hypothetical protein